MHSEAKLTAVSKPNVCVRLVEVVVDRLGHADDAQAGLVRRLAIVSEPSPPIVTRASMSRMANSSSSSSVRSTSM